VSEASNEEFENTSWASRQSALRCAAGLPGEQFASPDKALDARTIGHNPERLSLLQGGIVYANQVGSSSVLLHRLTSMCSAGFDQQASVLASGYEEPEQLIILCTLLPWAGTAKMGPSMQVTTVSPTYAADAMGGGGGALRETLGRKDIRAKFRVRH
jgi:hypothetical protein